MSKIATLFGGKPKTPAPAPLPKVVKREDPEIEAARKRALVSAKLRKGRKSTILTSGRGLVDGLGTSSPEARSAQLLG